MNPYLADGTLKPWYYNAIMRKVYMEYADQYGDYFLTLASKSSMPVLTFQKLVSEFHGRLDRELLGWAYYKQPSDLRTRGVMFLEEIDTHIHGHALVCFAGDRSRDDLGIACWTIWTRLCPGGTINLQRQLEDKSPASYATKEFEKLDHDDMKQVLLFSEFGNK